MDTAGAGTMGTGARIDLAATAAGPRVTLAGEIDMTCRPELEAVLETTRALPPSDVTVDLTGVGFFSSDGLAFLVQLYQQVHADGYDVVLVDPSPITLRALTLTGLTELFTVAATGSS
jgi:anti-anti-sigma factor